MFLNHNTMSTAMLARINLPIRTSRALALFANLLLLKLEFCRMTVVEILQGNADSYFHIRTLSLPMLSKVSAAAEKP
jgi:hypothetical protein